MRKSLLVRLVIISMITSCSNSTSDTLSPKSDQKSMVTTTNEFFKRDRSGSVLFAGTKINHVKRFDSKTERSISYLYLPYEEVKIYSIDGEEHSAFRYNNDLGMIENFKVENDLLIHESSETYYGKEHTKNNLYSFNYNCFGHTFCDGMFWLEMTNEDLNKIIESQLFVVTNDTSQIREGSRIVLFENNRVIHALRAMKSDLLQSKNGIHALKEYSSFSTFLNESEYAPDSILIIN